MKTILFLHGWHSVPGGVKPTYLKDHGHEVFNPALDNDFAAAVATAQAEFDKHQPQVVIGSSRGGAVAMNINSGDAKLVLLCPAWKNWGTNRAVKSGTIILHSRADDVIPFIDSEELARNSGATLIEVGNDHRLANADSLKALADAVRSFSPPATFSEKFPRAYHVIPLHACKSIASTSSLLSKADLLAAKIDLKRSSTADVDIALGLSKFVHFYLPKCKELVFEELPILQTQLKRSSIPPFPHVVISVPTVDLSDSQCGICNFNAAVSRPAYCTVKGGNHSRGMSSEKILGHWNGFRNDNPNAERLRHSYWHGGIAIPLILASQITRDPSKVGFRTNAAELLLRSPFKIPKSAKVTVFSDFDLASLSHLNHELNVEIAGEQVFDWYREKDRVEPKVRKAIDTYFLSKDSQPPQLNFDRQRPNAS